MKKLLLCFIAIALSCQMNAQTWCQPGASWYYTKFYQDGFSTMDGTVMLNFTGTATINNITCKQLDGTFYGISFTGPPSYSIQATPHTSSYGSYYTYESNHVAYLYNSDLQMFDTIADFNATIGESWGLALYSGTNCASGSRKRLTVIDTSHTLINGHHLKKLSLTYVYYGTATNTITMLETIGGFDEFLFEEQICVFDGSTAGNFRCYQDNTFSLYSKPGVTECVSSVGIKENTLSLQPVLIAPNPNNGCFSVQLAKPASLEVFNAMGALVYQSASQAGEASIDIRHVAAGIYYLKTKSGLVQRYSKIIKE